MMKKLLLPTLFSFGLASIASAHTGQGTHGAVDGLMHPLTGLDHLLAMVAVGIWSTQKGARSVWLLPTTFILCMIAGMLIGVSGINIPGTEYGIQASVVLLGIFLVMQLKLNQFAAAAIVGVFALVHGYAHGLEVPDEASRVSFCMGMVFATAMLHAIGIAIGLSAYRLKSENWIRVSGSVMAVYGVMLLSGVV